MRNCPQCKTTNDEHALKCVQCGFAITVSDDSSQTIDLSQVTLGAETDVQATLDVDFGSSSLMNSFALDRTIDGSDPTDVNRATANSESDGGDYSLDMGADSPSSLVRDNDSQVPIHAAQTLVLGDSGTDQRTYDGKRAKTAGQLDDIWKGAVGASVNPMQSLSAAGLQATDSIFERVAVRKVVDPKAKETVDADYRIVDKLGEGGMGVVFTARQTAIDRLVALKVAKPKYQKSSDARKRFLYEAQITADLDHSNIVPIHELGVTGDGTLFYSMKIVDGDQWSQVISEKTREQNLDIFMKVADAVAFAHSKGIIHRDLKPENTMLGRFGEVFVTDWGTAVNLNKDSSAVVESPRARQSRLKVRKSDGFQSGESIVITNDIEVLERNEIVGVGNGEITLARPLQSDYAIGNNLRIVKAFNLAGTPCYMAPEMAGHQINKIGCASDIYILGAILFDMVTGRPPHSGPTVTHCLMHALGNELIIPENAQDDALLSIALQAMSSEPSDRYKTAEQMQDAVRQYRRHSESIALTDRSSTLLIQAKESGDYQTFSRAMFGFRDAIDLWPENTEASEGLLASRLAFGEAAFAKGDYDLVIQTVDCNVPAEAELLTNAESAKQRRLERESRIKWLQRVVVTVVSIAIVGLSALSYYAINEQRKAVESALAEKMAKQEAQREKAEADAARKVAEVAQVNEQVQREIAERREIEAEERRKQAVQAQQAELIAKQDAQRKTIQIQLDDYKSSIALANSRLASFDVRSSREILEQLTKKGINISQEAPPAFKTWGWQRIGLLGNADLPQTTIEGRVTASAIAPSANLVAFSTDAGQILVYSVANGGLSLTRKHNDAGSKVTSIALSEDGSRLAYTYSNPDGSGIRFWSLDQQAPLTIRSTLGKTFQSILLTRNGRYLVSGISAGLWVWDLSKEDWHQEDLATYRLNNVRGRSVSVQELSEQVYLMTVDFNKERELRLVDVLQQTNELIPLPESIRDNFVCGLPMDDGHIAVGLRDNRMAILQFDGKQLSVQAVLEQKHAATISKIIQGPNDRLISMSESEPVAQVWKKVKGRWQHESFLAGLRDNLVDIQGTPGGEVVGVDSSSIAPGLPLQSRVIVWNIDRQIQRQRMERPVGIDRSSMYPESVAHIAAGAFDSFAFTVDANGCINAWNLRSGEVSQPVFSYVGHTPGAELVDSASHLESGVLVTVAKLRDSERAYLADRGATWEFCLWDLGSQQMVRRWTKTDQPLPGQTEPTSIEPRLTLLDHGTKLLMGSDTQTIIIDVKTGNELLSRDDWGSYFAIEHPQDNSQVLLVKRTGAIRQLDLKTYGWDEGKLDDVGLILASDSAPMQAEWAPSGEHFYIAYANGELAKLKIVDKKVSILWHSRLLGKDPVPAVSPVKSASSLQLKSGEVRIHSDIDLMLAIDGEKETVQTAIRTGSNERFTRHLAIQFEAGALQPKTIRLSDQPLRGNYWLYRDERGGVSLRDELHKNFAVDRTRVRIMQQRSSAVLVSNKSAQTYIVDRDSDVTTRVGRMPALSVTGNPVGNTVYCLVEDGSILTYQMTESRNSDIKKLGYALPKAKKIGLSSDSRFLATIVEGDLRVLNPVSGQLHKDLGKSVQFAWNPLAESELASCSEDGNATVYDSSFQIVRKISLGLQPGETCVGLYFFQESFDAPNVPHRRHLLVHTRDVESDYVNVVAIDGPPSVLKDSTVSNQHARVEETIRQRIAKDSLIAVSPTQGIFATGTDNGTVNVWYCSPTWGGPRELFDLDGHRGAKITAIAFTSDGLTLLTADDNKRLFAWVSKDPQAQ